MKIQVTTLRHTDRHGEELTLHASEDAAKGELYTTAVKPSWANVFCVDGAHCDVDGCTGVPADPDSLGRDDAIDTYFAHRTTQETHDLITQDLDVPDPAATSAWTDHLLAATPRRRAELTDLVKQAVSAANVVTVELPGLFDALLSTTPLGFRNAQYDYTYTPVLHRTYHAATPTGTGPEHSRTLTFHVSDTQACCEALIDIAQVLRVIANEAPTSSESQARADVCQLAIDRCVAAIAEATVAQAY